MWVRDIFSGHGFTSICLKIFGALPIITVPVTAEDEDILYGARANRTDVFDFNSQ